MSEPLADELGAGEGDAVLVRLHAASDVLGEHALRPARRPRPGDAAHRRRACGPGTSSASSRCARGRGGVRAAVRAAGDASAGGGPGRPRQRAPGLGQAGGRPRGGPRGRPLRGRHARGPRPAPARRGPRRGRSSSRPTNAPRGRRPGRGRHRRSRPARGCEVSEVFVYLANAIRVGEREVPYSLVAAVDPGTLAELTGSEAPSHGAVPPIVLNDWTATDLGAAPGARVTLDYFLWGEEGRLTTASTDFELLAVTPMTGHRRRPRPGSRLPRHHRVPARVGLGPAVPGGPGPPPPEGRGLLGPPPHDPQGLRASRRRTAALGPPPRAPDLAPPRARGRAWPSRTRDAATPRPCSPSCAPGRPAPSRRASS